MRLSLEYVLYHHGDRTHNGLNKETVALFGAVSDRPATQAMPELPRIDF
jgi:hypothetical protein